jgi:hypothetical protein
MSDVSKCRLINLSCLPKQRVSAYPFNQNAALAFILFNSIHAYEYSKKGRFVLSECIKVGFIQ